ncbi:Syndetin [Cryptotermes secundus]|uniref:Syndetin n=2 Tax=Cryptotermes secundus TaxID=105785 RepID=A0A2J7RFF2_9NEOP|nr:Syndetin [Cryptotermes secundus]
MEGLKHKWLSTINKQGLDPRRSSAVQPDEEVARFPTEEGNTLNRGSQPEARITHEDDPLADQDKLESIEPEYFSSEGFDPCGHELKKLPQKLDSDAIEKDFQKLWQQHVVVSKKVLQLIQQKHATFNEEFSRIVEVQQELQATLCVCREGRRDLNLAKRRFTTASLGILANYRKRQLVQGLLHSLNTIKTLQRTEERLQELLSEGNYPGAIRLLLECQSVAATYRHFMCVAALSGKLQDTLLTAEEQLDQALAKVCSHFDSDHYSKVQAAYNLLGKTQMAMDQLHMHFASAIHNATFSVVYGYVELCSGAAQAESSAGGNTFHKKQYEQLCECVTAESFIPCLVDLCKALWGIMRSYHQVVSWHQRKDSEKLSADGVSEPLYFEESFNKQYVKEKLGKGLVRIWHDVQARVLAYLLGSDLSWYKFDEFLHILGIVHRLMEIGEEFCASKSEALQNSIKKQSSNYFRNYHHDRLEELRIFLENESWEMCPVKPDFTILQLQEFRSLRHILKTWKPRAESVNGRQTAVSSPDCSSSNHSQDGSSITGGYFARYSESGSPFDVGFDEVQEEDILANIGDEPSGYFSDESDEDIPEELKKDFVDENVGDTVINRHSKPNSKKFSRRELMKAPILTNTTLTVLRQCGKYLQMSHLLRPIAFEVIVCMSQLFDYYLYAVHAFFTTDLPVSFRSVYNLNLQTSLKRIQDSLVVPSHLTEAEQDQTERTVGEVPEPHISPVVDLTQRETLHGLAERVVAVESLIFLAKQLEFLHDYLEHLQGGSSFLQQFFSQTVTASAELRRPVYMCVAATAVDSKVILALMAKVNWEVKEVMSQHSKYVDILLRELQIFSMRLEEVVLRIPIPQEVYLILWESIIQLTCKTFVEGFSNAKKCSTGGRGLMQLDFSQFLSKLKKLTSIRPIPGTEYVEHYIKAYYLQEAALESWVREHNEYSSKHLLALVSCVCQNDKKTRQRLTALIEDMEIVGSR